MRILVNAKTGASREHIERQTVAGKIVYYVYTNAHPKDGKANEAICRMLADYFLTKRTSIIIRSGISGRKKIIEILGM